MGVSVFRRDGAYCRPENGVSVEEAPRGRPKKSPGIGTAVAEIRYWKWMRFYHMRMISFLGASCDVDQRVPTNDRKYGVIGKPNRHIRRTPHQTVFLAVCIRFDTKLCNCAVL